MIRPDASRTVIYVVFIDEATYPMDPEIESSDVEAVAKVLWENRNLKPGSIALRVRYVGSHKLRFGLKDEWTPVVQTVKRYLAQGGPK
jgi:hypothetical protein